MLDGCVVRAIGPRPLGQTSLQASSAQALGVTQDQAAQGQGPDSLPHSGPFAVLTRASIVPTKAMAFWRYAPAAQADLGQAAGCLLAMGLGEAPLVRQCTFSLWQDTAAMLQYARQGAHQVASTAAYKHQFFSESLFVRMQVLRMAGVWQGRSFDAPALAAQNTTPVDASPAGGRLSALPGLEVSHV